MPYLYFLTQVYRIHKVHMVLNEIYTQTNLNKLERDFDL